ncbi:MAG: O-antigen ligase family protein [Clostridia bacterium]|nr:O-antigen ligase family protein [Clostridia bacterium]
MQNKIMQKTTSLIEQEGSIAKTIKLSIISIISFILFVTPFFRGTYFEPDQLSAAIVIFTALVLFGGYKLMTKDKALLKTPLDYALALLVIMYAISVLYAVGTRNAVIEVVKYLMYFSLFVIVSKFAISRRFKITVFITLIITAIAVCFIGYDGATGEHVTKVLNRIFEATGIPLLIKETFLIGRIYSVFQYPNVTGAYLAAILLLCLGFMAASQIRTVRLVLGVCSYIIMTTLLLTFSKGAILAFSLALIIMFIALPKGTRAKLAVYSVISAISMGIATIPFPKSPMKLLYYISNNVGNEKAIWLALILGAAIAAVLFMFSDIILKIVEKVRIKVYLILLIVCIVLGAAATLIVLNSGEAVTIGKGAVTQGIPEVIEKTVSIEADKEYTLDAELNLRPGDNKVAQYKVEVFSMSEKNLNIDGGTLIAQINGAPQNGKIYQKLTFRTLKETQAVNIVFTALDNNSIIKLNSLKLLNADNKLYKNTILKYKYIPENIAAMLQNQDISSSKISRSMFYKDGIKMFKDHPVFGAGGGAWVLLYQKYQSYFYQSNEPHSFAVQVLIETGIVGALVLILVLVTLVLMLVIYRVKRNIGCLNSKIINSAVFAAISLLLMHSFIDFDFSLSAMSILLWVLLGIFNSEYIRGYEPIEIKNKAIDKGLQKVDKVFNKFKSLNIYNAVLILGALLLISIPLCLKLAVVYEQKSFTASKNNDIERAKSYMAIASRLDSFKAESKIDYANLIILQSKISSEDAEKLQELVLKAERLGKYNAYMCSNLGLYYLKTGNADKALEYFSRVSELAPLRPENWEQELNVYSTIIFYYFGKAENDKAIEYLDKAFQVIDKAIEINSKNYKPFVFTDKTIRLIEIFRNIKDNYGKSDIINPNNLVFTTLNDLDVNFDNIPDQWSSDNPNDIKITKDNEYVTLENSTAAKDVYIKSRALSLFPDKAYVINIELAGSNLPNEIKYTISGISVENCDKMVKNSNLYTAVFTTPKDFKPSQYERLFLNVEGSYHIKSITITEV